MKSQRPPTDLNEVLNYLTDIIMFCDQQFNVVDSNQAANVILGKGNSIIGSKCHELLHNNATPCSDCPLDDTIKSGRLKSFNYFNESIDEYLEERTHPIMDG